MGDRATVIFTSNNELSPAIYLHWQGEDIPYLIARCRALMDDRACDLDYTAARFVQIAAGDMSGNLSVGISNAPKTLDECRTDGFSPGDAGVFIVHVDEFRAAEHGKPGAAWQGNDDPRSNIDIKNNHRVPWWRVESHNGYGFGLGHDERRFSDKPISDCQFEVDENMAYYGPRI